MSTWHSPTRLGPFGDPAIEWDDWQQASDLLPMSGLTVRHGDVIDAIEAAYGDEKLPLHGGSGGKASANSFAGDPIVAVEGVTGDYFGADHVAQLVLTTREGKHLGPFGSAANVQAPQYFEMRAPEGEYIEGFFGSVKKHSDGTTFLAGIGAYAAPLPDRVGVDGPVGESNTHVFDDWSEARYLGLIRSVEVWSGDIVDAIQVGYNGATLEKHGGAGGGSQIAHFTNEDPLVEVKGFIGRWFGATHVLQLTLVSESGETSGPYGSMGYAESKTPFSLRGEGRIGAFSGGSFLHDDGSEALSALGVTIVR